MKKSYRQGRMGEEIRRIVCGLLLRGLKDPGLHGMVGVSGVEVTSDGSYATLYVTVPAGEGRDAATDEEKQGVIDAFHRAKGLLRREIGAQLRLRHTPDLIFKIDASQEYGRRIERIFDSLGASREMDDADEGLMDEK
jgi:ribosome-binding factor A